MRPKRLALKLFTRTPVARETLSPYIAVFHRFIQEAAVPGLLVDVADYAHVPDGPGIALIGHEVDYGLDLVGGRSGLLCVSKREGGRELGELFGITLGRLAAAARALEAAEEVDVAFATDALELVVFDRLAAPNTAESAALAQKELEPAARERLGAGVALEHVSGDDPRRALTLHLSGAAIDLAALAERG